MLSWCVAWLVGLCTRVELGGLKACGVFVLSFVLFLVLLLLLSLLVLLSSACPLSLWLVVSFSLSDVQAKREGAIPCVLSCSVVGLFIGSQIVPLFPAVHRPSIYYRCR